MSDQKSPRDNMMCSAYGCPLLGTMSSGAGWRCFCHHGADDNLQQITAELRRLEWLANACRDFRLYYGRPEIESVRQRFVHDAAMHSRHDLKGKSPVDLERELQNMVRAAIRAKHEQQSAPLDQPTATTT
jgi:hypothetical protein